MSDWIDEYSAKKRQADEQRAAREREAAKKAYEPVSAVQRYFQDNREQIAAAFSRVKMHVKRLQSGGVEIGATTSDAYARTNNINNGTPSGPALPDGKLDVTYQGIYALSAEVCASGIRVHFTRLKRTSWFSSGSWTAAADEIRIFRVEDITEDRTLEWLERIVKTLFK
jgi:hypothetical protein